MGADPSKGIRFGTDGWRAIIGEGFTDENLAMAVDAAARTYAADGASGRIYIGFDCRSQASRYAVLAASIVAARGFEAVLSDRFCPTPALCWTVSRDPDAIGGIMITSSHNPAEYLGIKLRLSDGGASPKEFTDAVEDLLAEEPPVSFAQAKELADTAWSAGFDGSGGVTGIDGAPFALANIMEPYIANLKSLVDAEAIRAANLRVVVDPMFGSGRGYLAGVLRDLGVEVHEVNSATDPTFNGLHPEPIRPWIDFGAEAVVEGGYDAGLVVDGDADRIGAVDESGAFVSPHKIISLMVMHLVEDKGLRGRVVRTYALTSMLERLCEAYGLELVTRPVGFKWVYVEMVAGDVLIGGEESGGIGIPTHVKERDGLLMALLIVEMMAQRRQTLGELVQALFAKAGAVEYARRDLRISPELKERFLDKVETQRSAPNGCYSAPCAISGIGLSDIETLDGIKFKFANGAWLLMRPSGTEPLVRVYCEAPTMEDVDALLDWGCSFVTD